VMAFPSRIPIDEHCRLGSILPLSHLFELTCGLLYPLSRGAAIHYIPSRRGADVVRVLAEQRVTHMMAVPQLLTLMGNALEQRLQARLPAQVYRALNSLAERVSKQGLDVLSADELPDFARRYREVAATLPESAPTAPIRRFGFAWSGWWPRDMARSIARSAIPGPGCGASSRASAPPPSCNPDATCCSRS